MARPEDLHLTVRSADALRSLTIWMRSLPHATQARGATYFHQRRVLMMRALSAREVGAVVEGGDEYDVRLGLQRLQWSSSCSCPMGLNCKHAVAAGLAWVNGGGADFQTDMAEDQRGPPAPGFKRSSFAEKWKPRLEQKLGRALSEDERRMLGRLNTLFSETEHQGPDASALHRHGFADTIPEMAPSYGPVFRDWYEAGRAPADPWELWQLLAFSLELRNRPIPEVFRPMTDTAPIWARIDSLVAKAELDVWRAALEIQSPPTAVRAPGLESCNIARLCAMFTREGDLCLHYRTRVGKAWKPLTMRLIAALAEVNRLSDAEPLPPAEAELALLVAPAARKYRYTGQLLLGLPDETVARLLSSPAALEAVFDPSGAPITIEPEPLVPEAVVASGAKERLEVKLRRPDGGAAEPARLIGAGAEHFYWHRGRVWRGPPPLPSQRLPFAALSDPVISGRLRAIGMKLPASLELQRRVVKLQAHLRLWTEHDGGWTHLGAQLFAHSERPPVEQTWHGPKGWVRTVELPARGADDPIWELDSAVADVVAAALPRLRLTWNDFTRSWTRGVGPGFPEEFTEWRKLLPSDVVIDVSQDLASLFEAPVKAKFDFSLLPQDSAHDWFDVRVGLRVEDTTLTPAEVELLVRARGKWVRMPKGGWRRLEVEAGADTAAAAAALERLGLITKEGWNAGEAVVHRVHAVQLASEVETIQRRDAAMAAALRKRALLLQSAPEPEVPAGLRATLRPYQCEGFHFLVHLAANRLGGVLADDMGLGKTVQALAWLLHLAGETRPAARRLRVLVVCPKSVTHGWIGETERFAPTLAVRALTSELAEKDIGRACAELVIANYTQLRLQAKWLHAVEWDAVILDEAQFVKNPASQTAVAARGLRATHRLALTGTPVENRLTDLWSIFAFVQPGLLGTKEGFRRQFNETDPEALARVHRRVRHFLLRRTKAQAAPDLPAKTEDDLFVDLEPGQRRLYDAELKRARQQLLGIESDRALDKVRFNVLASLLRLRQICCHPALVDPAHADLPSAKLEALLERIEELRDEGHQVLVFSQFVEMLEIIRARLVAGGIGHLMLTGATENRAELVAEFQRDKSRTVFLLSLKAAGFGLNLTAASYAVLYDPWWNPAVEAQAIDRTHRIGQTRGVIAYRLLARDSVEEKIRALQQEKAALAAAVVKEESLARVLDLESLRRILG